MLTLKQQTILSIKWQVGISLAQKIISFGGTLILARFLGPSVFGLFALTMVIVNAFDLFKSLGIDSALIRRQDDFEKAADTAFILIPMFGIFLYALLYFFAPIISNFLNNSELLPLIRALGIVFVISCFARVPTVLLEKNMRFREISIAEFSSSVISTVLAVILTLCNWGVWALVYSYILKVISYMIIIWIYTKWRPKFDFDRKIAFELFGFGKFVFLTCVLLFLKMNTDNFLVGKLLGITMLGFYGIAFNIANLVPEYVGGKINRVIYPAYSKLQNDPLSLRTNLLKALKFVSIATFPIGIIIFILGKDFLEFAFGPQWLGAGTILQLLAWIGIFNALPVVIGPLFLACGKPKYGLILGLLEVGIFFVFIIPCAKLFGLNGVGIVVSSASFITCSLSLILCKRLLNLSIRELFLSLKSSILATLLMLIGISVIKVFFINSLSFFKIYPCYRFFFLLTCAFSIYIFILMKTEKSFLKEIKEFV